MREVVRGQAAGKHVKECQEHWPTWKASCSVTTGKNVRMPGETDETEQPFSIARKVYYVGWIKWPVSWAGETQKAHNMGVRELDIEQGKRK